MKVKGIIKGDRGFTGASGPQGPQGVQGVKGDPGENSVNADWNSSSGKSQILNKPSSAVFSQVLNSDTPLTATGIINVNEVVFSEAHGLAENDCIMFYVPVGTAIPTGLAIATCDFPGLEQVYRKRAYWVQYVSATTIRLKLTYNGAVVVSIGAFSVPYTFYKMVGTFSISGLTALDSADTEMTLKISGIVINKRASIGGASTANNISFNVGQGPVIGYTINQGNGSAWDRVNLLGSNLLTSSNMFTSFIATLQIRRISAKKYSIILTENIYRSTSASPDDAFKASNAWGGTTITVGVELFDVNNIIIQAISLTNTECNFVGNVYVSAARSLRL